MHGDKVSCKKCDDVKIQVKRGKLPSGSQRYFCKICKYWYTPVTKHYSEDIKKLTIKAYLSGVSARGVGRIYGIDGNTVIAWLKNFRKSKTTGKPIRHCRDRRTLLVHRAQGTHRNKGKYVCNRGHKSQKA